MAAFIFFLLLISAVKAADQQNISPGSFLITPASNSSSSSSWLSPSGRYAFGFFQQKNNTFAVGIFINNKKTGQTIVWTANTKNPTVANDAVLNLTKDGRLILQQRQGQENIDVVGADNHTEAIAHASMLDSGNFVLYGSGSRIIIWQSFDHPTDTLLPGQRLPAGGELFSSASDTDHSRGIFKLRMQSDGNLVQYPVMNTPDTATNAYYASGTAEAGGNVSLNLADDGRLYLLNGSSFLLNITRGGLPTRGTIHLMRIDADGIFRTYSHDSLNNDSWIVRWSSTDDKCVPKGVCGLNAFCVLMDMNARCECLPSHDLVRSGDSSADCARGSTWKGCGNNNKYEMKTVNNTVWEDNSYSVLNTPMIEDCMRACLNDWNCEAAFFKNDQCSKQRLPLRFGRRQPGDSNVALIKV